MWLRIICPHVTAATTTHVLARYVNILQDKNSGNSVFFFCRSGHSWAVMWNHACYVQTYSEKVFPPLIKSFSEEAKTTSSDILTFFACVASTFAVSIHLFKMYIQIHCWKHCWHRASREEEGKSVSTLMSHAHYLTPSQNTEKTRAI